MELYGSDNTHDFWWDGPGTKESPYGLWNITPKGGPAPLGGYVSKKRIEWSKRTRFDNPRMKRS
jgi:hypothetical protein